MTTLHTGLRFLARRRAEARGLADIVMRDTLHVAPSHGQHGLGATEGLDLRLLIYRQHDSVIWRVQVQGDDIAYLPTKKGSLDSLKVLLRWGCRAKL